MFKTQEGAKMKVKKTRGQQAKAKRPTHRVKKRGQDSEEYNPATSCCCHSSHKHLDPDVARRAEHSMIAYGEVEGFGDK